MKQVRNAFKVSAVHIVISLCLLLAFGRLSNAQVQSVPIAPVSQQSVVWCWAAVSEMVLNHYRFPNNDPADSYQCSIVKSMGGICTLGCEYCHVGVNTIWHLSTVIKKYQKISDTNIAGHEGQHFRVVPEKRRVSPRRIIKEIDSFNPIVTVISPNRMSIYYPPGMGEHVALIVGYNNSGGKFTILVNDPWPFSLFGYDPYLTIGAKSTIPGQYWVDYDTFARQMFYKDSITFEPK